MKKSRGKKPMFWSGLGLDSGKESGRAFGWNLRMKSAARFDKDIKDKPLLKRGLGLQGNRGFMPRMWEGEFYSKKGIENAKNSINLNIKIINNINNIMNI